VSALPAAAPQQLPRTGLGTGLPLAATALLGAAAVVALRRRTAALA
jgi:LPXTG-motif cell wall-anchored protein